MATDAPNASLTIDLSTPIDSNSGVAIALAHASMYMNSGSTFTGYSSDAYESDTSDDDAEMSDGGVQIDMSVLHAEQLNAEMDMVDAEVMGPYNLAAIAITSAFHADLDQHDPQLSGFTEYGPEDHTVESDYDILEDDDDADFISQGAHISDPMSEVAQQLQHIQDGQEQGELATSAPLHGTTHNHSIDSFSSLLPISWVSDNEHNSLPHLNNVFSSMGHYSGATAATAGPLLGANIAGQATDLALISSEVDWGEGGAWDSDDAGDEENMTHANELQVDDQHNLNLRDFLYTWGVCATRRGASKKRKRGPNLACLDKLGEERPAEIQRYDLQGDRCDCQGIDWTTLEVSRRDARKMRISTYRNYTNLSSPVWHELTLRRSSIGNPENYFRFHRMDFKPKITLSHFQLRNLLACTSRNNICYAGESKVYSINPFLDQKALRMDLRDPIIQTPNSNPFTGIQISTIAADHNILIAGGFTGEYAMTQVDSPLRTDHVEGLLTTDPNPITNHIQIHLNRHSGLPQAAFASNDTTLRILDCTTNKIVAQHKYDYAVNCSAISPDHRLRVIVGDNRNVIICNAEKGEVLQDLAGHVDYGFACAWADNGWHVATGNQDKLIKIWDARMWTDQNGMGKPLETISATMAGARSLKFSPLGSGKRVLVAAEAADIVSVINAETYVSKQTLDVVGEICGVDFTPDGQGLFIGIHDSLRGGIMEFQRCGFGEASGYKDSLNENSAIRDGPYRVELEEQAAGFDWKKTESEIVNDRRSMRTATHRKRKAAQTWDIGTF